MDAASLSVELEAGRTDGRSSDLGQTGRDEDIHVVFLYNDINISSPWEGKEYHDGSTRWLTCDRCRRRLTNGTQTQVENRGVDWSDTSGSKA